MDGDLYYIFQDKYGGHWYPDIIKDALRLKAGEPVDYIIGWKPFLNCKIDLSLKPLIPRLETEYWTEKVIRAMGDKPVKCLDIFAGSGCIGVAVLKNNERAQVDLADFDLAAIKQIKINLKLNKIYSKRYKVIRSNVFNEIRANYDFILANPPYIPTKNKKKVQPGVLKYEPRRALFGGDDGLYYVRKFLKAARPHLKPGGQVWMEFDGSEKKAIACLVRKYKYSRLEFYKDQYKKWRYVRINL